MAQAKADLAEIGAKVDQLAEAQRHSLIDRVDSMTKAELQALADDRAITGVDQTAQTRDEMVAVIRQALLG